MVERADLPTWREAWQQALYGPEGFYRRHRPADHFRTSVHASRVFAEATLALAKRHDLATVVDVGAGSGELLTALHELDPSLALMGVEVADRPADLSSSIEWRSGLPARIEGLVVANEWLDNIPCDVVQVDDAGVVRLVHVDPRTGTELLGATVEDAWLHEWWPLREPGARAEIGAPRDSAWAEVVDRLDHGLAVAIDYGHLHGSRPAFGSLASYRGGRVVDPIPDGSCDVTAHVAMDSLGADRLVTQREMLHSLGVTGERPSPALAQSDPSRYVRALSRASEAAELTARGGLGDFLWALSSRSPSPAGDRTT